MEINNQDMNMPIIVNSNKNNLNSSDQSNFQTVFNIILDQDNSNIPEFLNDGFISTKVLSSEEEILNISHSETIEEDEFGLSKDSEVLDKSKNEQLINNNGIEINQLIKDTKILNVILDLEKNHNFDENKVSNITANNKDSILDISAEALSQDSIITHHDNERDKLEKNKLYQINKEEINNLENPAMCEISKKMETSKTINKYHNEENLVPEDLALKIVDLNNRIVPLIDEAVKKVEDSQVSNSDHESKIEVSNTSLSKFMGLDDGIVQMELGKFKDFSLTNKPELENKNNSSGFNSITNLDFQKSNLDGIVKVVNDEFSTIKDGIPSVIKLKLQPENLGNLEIHLSKNNGEISTKFLVETGKVQDLINNQLKQIEINLLKQDIEINEMEVLILDSSSNSNFDLNQQFSQQNRSNKRKFKTNLSTEYQQKDMSNSGTETTVSNEINILV